MSDCSCRDFLIKCRQTVCASEVLRHHGRMVAFEKHEWEAVSAIATCLGVCATLAAVVWAMFGESFQKRWRRPVLSVSCGDEALLFQPRDSSRTHADIRLLVTNCGRESARNVQCTLQVIREWEDGKWNRRLSFLPLRLYWQIERDICLPVLAPESSCLLDLGVLSDPTLVSGGGPREIYLHTMSSGTRLTMERTEVEIIITSDDHLHYHGFFEIDLKPERFIPIKESFTIKETRRITFDQAPWWKHWCS